MFEIVRSASRGRVDHGWLLAKHSFSFGDYYNPERMGFGALRVINEDRIAAKKGFGTHPHRDMEIVTYIISGSLEHEDSMGHGSTIHAGELQRMTAGTGVYHSERNPSDDETHLLQIWILPDEKGLEPGYEQKLFDEADKLNAWHLIGSPDGRGGSLTIHQDIRVLATILESGRSLEYHVDDSRRAYMHIVDGELSFGDEILQSGDAAAIENLNDIMIKAIGKSEVLMFDMA